MAWNHEGTYSGDIADCWVTLKRKVSSLYPTYLFGCFIAVLNMWLTGELLERSLPDVTLPAIAHLLLIQSWFSADVAFRFNGATWYLSSVLFCYVITPVLSWILRGVSRWANRLTGVVCLCFGCFAFAMFIEIGVLEIPNGFNVSVHMWPPICLARYGMGYFAGCLLPELRKAGSRWFAVADVPLTVVVIASLWLLGGVLPRSVFTLLFTIWITLLAMERGIVSRVFTLKPLIIAGRYELEFYVLHQPCLKLMSLLMGTALLRRYVVLSAFMLIGVMSVIVKCVLKEWRMIREKLFRE